MLPANRFHRARLGLLATPVLLGALASSQARLEGAPSPAPLHCDRGLSRSALVAELLVSGSASRPNANAPGPDSTSRQASNMVWIPAGRFWMGTDALDDARPVHQVSVSGFWIDRTEVTNEEFARFVAATGYLTTAEQPLDPERYPGLSADERAPGSVVFSPPAQALPLTDHLAWWRFVKGASWRHPQGPGSDIIGKEKYPVVQVSWTDAAAYAAWAGKRLPTEAEFEFASRGGLDRKAYGWGDELTPGGRWQANTFQGHFPDNDTAADGYAGLAPVASYPANGYGLFDMTGNVWEWTADWYRADYYSHLAARDAEVANPVGPADSFDPEDPGVAKRVQKGGSYLCSEQYCQRYIAGSRGKGEPETATNHTGFRCVRGASTAAGEQKPERLP